MHIKKLISQTSELPTLPMVAARINQEMQSEALTAKLLGEIIAEDTALASKVLRLANSAYYGLPKQVTTLNKAVMILGFNTVKNLALSVSIHTLFQKPPDSPIDLQGLWLHSLGCAAAAKILIEQVKPKLGDDAFLFGILHDIGKIVIINEAPQDYEKILHLMHEENVPQNDAEMQVIDTTHQKLGALLLDHWKFPDSIVAAVKYHHDADLSGKKLEPDLKDLVYALFLGNQIVRVLSLGKSSSPKRTEIPMIIWESLNIKREQLKPIAATIAAQYALLLKAWDMELASHE
ncbi:MAG: HDOD domain-containing protein [Thermodesulfobacteriota bacterium]